MMNSEQQYIDLYGQCREMICQHSCEVMNARRDEAFERFKANGFPTRKGTSSGLSKLFVIFSCPLIKLFSDQLPFFGGKVICLLWLEIIQHSALRVLLRSFRLAV